MHSFLERVLVALQQGEQLEQKSALQLALCPDIPALCAIADAVRRHFHQSRFHLCSIINAKSGSCSEDCRYCAQSARYSTDALSYSFIDNDKALAIAQENEQHGVERLSLVCSGRAPNQDTLEQLVALYGKIQKTTPELTLCASAGLLTHESAEKLHAVGVERYHCNLESSQSYFPQICTSHSYDDKIETLAVARQAGMSLCSGGIIGMGESMEQRIELAFALRDNNILSIPINILTPIAGTPLARKSPPPLQEVLITVALFRLINPQAVIRMAGGRQQYGKEQYRFFTAGANGAIVGNYLTTAGNSMEKDIQTIKGLGYDCGC